MILAYDGVRYHGWQRQKGDTTIQGTIEDNLETMLGDPVTLIASGRTDAGVHAHNQVCNFRTFTTIEPEAIKRGLNSLLPNDILIKQAEYVPPDFHARYSARSKTYEYRILNRETPDLFRRHYLWHIRIPLDTARMAQCLNCIVGSYDFSAFRSSGSANMDPVRSVSRADIHGPDKEGLIRITMAADGFLRHMVRNIVGTLVEAGMEKLGLEQFRDILESRDRQQAGIKAPANGLFLIDVKY